jgi:hypothetical protein
VHRRRHRHPRQAGGHELQQRHLGGGVLHGDAVGVELAVAALQPRRRDDPGAAMAGLTDRGASVGLSVNRCGWRLLI